MEEITQRKSNTAMLGKMDVHMHGRSEKLVCSVLVRKTFVTQEAEAWTHSLY
jgi:hypothetical protein